MQEPRIQSTVDPNGKLRRKSRVAPTHYNILLRGREFVQVSRIQRDLVPCPASHAPPIMKYDRGRTVNRREQVECLESLATDRTKPRIQCKSRPALVTVRRWLSWSYRGMDGLNQLGLLSRPVELPVVCCSVCDQSYSNEQQSGPNHESENHHVILKID